MSGPTGGLQHVMAAAGEIARRDFAGQQLEKRGETAAIALAARAKAEVEARFLMAMHRPRDLDTFRQRLLKECRRPGFAAVAEYERPVGREFNEETKHWEQKIARGPSIRLLETAIQHFGNIDAQAPVTYETDEVRVVRALMVDLETNASWSTDVVVPKRVEKRADKSGGPPKGREVISQRTNSSGETTYTVNATDSEVTVLQSALISKAQRKNGERLLPSDILQEALSECRKTVQTEDAQDPDAAKRRVIDGFASINITPRDLVEYLSKPLDRLNPADVKELRGIFVSVNNGELTWEAALQLKQESMMDGGSREEQNRVRDEKLAALNNKPAQRPSPIEGNRNGMVTPKHILELRAWRETLGGEQFGKILGAHGFEAINDVPAESFVAIQEALAQHAQDSGKATPTANDTEKQNRRSPGRLKL